jgi:hypothetical protein
MNFRSGPPSWAGIIHLTTGYKLGDGTRSPAEAEISLLPITRLWRLTLVQWVPRALSPVQTVPGTLLLFSGYRQLSKWVPGTLSCPVGTGSSLNGCRGLSPVQWVPGALSIGCRGLSPIQWVPGALSNGCWGLSPVQWVQAALSNGCRGLSPVQWVQASISNGCRGLSPVQWVPGVLTWPMGTGHSLLSSGYRELSPTGAGGSLLSSWYRKLSPVQ